MSAWFHCNFQSCILRMNVDVGVLIPERARIEGIETKANRIQEGNKRPLYQTLYLLHGFSGDYMSYLRSSNIDRYSEENQIAVVMPSVYNSAYTDMKYGLDYFTYVADELMDFIEQTFPVSPHREDRFVAGMSMGGYGAYKLGLSHPERFSAIAGLAGSYHAEYRYQGKVSTVSTLCEALYGDPPQIVPEIHDIFTMMKKRKEEGVKMPRMYTCCGTEDRRHQDSVDLKKFADANGIDLTFEQGPGRHDSLFFDEYIQRVLQWFHLKEKPL